MAYRKRRRRKSLNKLYWDSIDGPYTMPYPGVICWIVLDSLGWPKPYYGGDVMG